MTQNDPKMVQKEGPIVMGFTYLRGNFEVAFVLSSRFDRNWHRLTHLEENEIQFSFLGF